jgi:hypothetical protein
MSRQLSIADRQSRLAAADRVAPRQADVSREWKAHYQDEEPRASTERRILPRASATGAAAIRKQNPHDQQQRSKKSAPPLFHAASKRVSDDPGAEYYAFLAAFRETAERLKAGIL